MGRNIKISNTDEAIYLASRITEEIEYQKTKVSKNVAESLKRITNQTGRLTKKVKKELIEILDGYYPKEKPENILRKNIIGSLRSYRHQLKEETAQITVSRFHKINLIDSLRGTRINTQTVVIENTIKSTILLRRCLASSVKQKKKSQKSLLKRSKIIISQKNNGTTYYFDPKKPYYHQYKLVLILNGRTCQ